MGKKYYSSGPWLETALSDEVFKHFFNKVTVCRSECRGKEMRDAEDPRNKGAPGSLYYFYPEVARNNVIMGQSEEGLLSGHYSCRGVTAKTASKQGRSSGNKYSKGSRFFKLPSSVAASH